MKRVAQYQIWGVRGMQNKSHAFFDQIFLHRQSRVNRSSVVVEKSISTAPLLRSSLPHIFL
jgi:hypothetical protein